MVAFVVRPDRPEVAVVPLGPSKDLADLVQTWRASYGAGKTPPRDTPDPASELRKRLWEPLARYLEGAKVVLISPDGPLDGLPLAALPGSKPGTFLVHGVCLRHHPGPPAPARTLTGQGRRTGRSRLARGRRHRLRRPPPRRAGPAGQPVSAPARDQGRGLRRPRPVPRRLRLQAGRAAHRGGSDRGRLHEPGSRLLSPPRGDPRLLPAVRRARSGRVRRGDGVLCGTCCSAATW